MLRAIWEDKPDELALLLKFLLFLLIHSQKTLQLNQFNPIEPIQEKTLKRMKGIPKGTPHFIYALCLEGKIASKFS